MWLQIEELCNIITCPEYHCLPPDALEDSSCGAYSCHLCQSDEKYCQNVEATPGRAFLSGPFSDIKML